MGACTLSLRGADTIAEEFLQTTSINSNLYFQWGTDDRYMENLTDDILMCANTGFMNDVENAVANIVMDSKVRVSDDARLDLAKILARNKPEAFAMNGNFIPAIFLEEGRIDLYQQWEKVRSQNNEQKSETVTE